MSVTARVIGPWPLFCDYTLLTLETKCSISFIEVGLQTKKLLSKMHFNFAVTESQNDGIMEGHGKSNIAPPFSKQYSPIFSAGL